jgi:hypothetical protein
VTEVEESNAGHSALIGLLGRKVVEPTREELEAGQEAQARNQARDAARAYSLAVFDADEVERAGRLGEYLAADGLLFEPLTIETSGIAVPGRSLEDAAAVVIPDQGLPVFLKRPPRGEAQTLDDLAKQRERVRRRRREAEREKAEAIRSQPLEPLLLERLEGRPLPSLRRAAELVERHHGVIEDDDGRLVFSFHGKAPPDVADAVRVLRAERALVLAALAEKAGEQALSELLPDEQARA